MNASDTPIYSVALLAEHPVRAVWYEEQVLPTGSEAIRLSTEEMRGVPNRLVFRDKLGRGWFRSDMGELRQQTESEKYPLAVVITNYFSGIDPDPDRLGAYAGYSWKEDWPSKLVA